MNAETVGFSKNNKLKLISSKGVSRGYTPYQSFVKIRGLKDARRLLSKLIYQLQTGEVTGQQAKDLCYLLVSYVNILKDTEFEDRLKILEEKANNNQ